MSARDAHSLNSEALVLPSLPAASLSDGAFPLVWDVIVVGAGVAGATIAQRLARRGWSVLLVEKKAFPRFKVCGGCLNVRSLHHLNRLGLREVLDHSGAPVLDSVTLYAAGHRARVSLPGGRAISRHCLDTLLVSAACAAGAVWLPETVATLDRRVDGEGRVVCVTQSATGKELRAGLVIAADGLGGSLFDAGGGEGMTVASSSRIGLGAFAPAGSENVPAGGIKMYCGRRGYVGVVQVEGGGIDLAASVQRDAVRDSGGPAGCIAAIFEEAGQVPPVPLADLNWRGTPPLTRRRRAICAERLLVLGDAAGYVEPFTGEGMAWAFESAFRLDSHLEGRDRARWSEGVQSWARECNNGRHGRHIVCRSLSVGLRQPALTRMAVRLLARAPLLSRPIVCGLNRIARS